MDNNALESKMPIQGKMLSSTFYTVLDNFESDGTCFTTDDDLECSDNTECKWDVPARAKLSKVSLEVCREIFITLFYSMDTEILFQLRMNQFQSFIALTKQGMLLEIPPIQ